MTRFTPPTKRSGMSRTRAARIFVARCGECGICHQPIYQGEPYEIEHPDPLWAGGSDNDADLWPVHVKCHAGKTAREATERAKRDRIVTASWVGARKPKSKWKRKISGEVVLREPS